MRLLLVRHGESLHRVRDIVSAEHGCPGLTDLGRRQVAALRDRFAAERLRVDVLLTSPAARARQTAELLRPALGAPPLVEERGLTELRLGESEGLTGGEFRARYEPSTRSPNPTGRSAPVVRPGTASARASATPSTAWPPATGVGPSWPPRTPDSRSSRSWCCSPCPGPAPERGSIPASPPSPSGGTTAGRGGWSASTTPPTGAEVQPRPTVLRLGTSRWAARTSTPGSGSALPMRSRTRSTAVAAMAALSGEIVLIGGLE